MICLGKSTYARLGIIVNTTPAEASWEGHLTLEFSNSSGADCRIYADEGICQLLFFEGDPCETTYSDRQGKYQHQPERHPRQGVSPPSVKGPNAPCEDGSFRTRLRIRVPTSPCVATSGRTAAGSPAEHRAWLAGP